MRNLVRSTPEWRRAFDISTITLPLATKANRRGNDPRPFTALPEVPLAATNSARESSFGLLRVIHSDGATYDHSSAEMHAKH
jgi:hypothetical protein